MSTAFAFRYEQLRPQCYLDDDERGKEVRKTQSLSNTFLLECKSSFCLSDTYDK